MNLVNLVMQKMTRDKKKTIFTKKVLYFKNVHIFPKIICVYENFVVILHSERKEMNIFMSEFTPPML